MLVTKELHNNPKYGKFCVPKILNISYSNFKNNPNLHSKASKKKFNSRFEIISAWNFIYNNRKIQKRNVTYIRPHKGHLITDLTKI